jgi:hypothetical protein
MEVLHDHSVVGPLAEGVLNGGPVGVPAVGGQLRARPLPERLRQHQPAREVADEQPRRLPRPLADCEAGNQLRLFVQRHEQELVAERRVGRLFRPEPGLLLPNEGPDFTALQMLQGEIPHPPVHEGAQPLAGAEHQFRRRRSVDAGRSGDAAEAGPFHQQTQDGELVTGHQDVRHGFSSRKAAAASVECGFLGHSGAYPPGDCSRDC